MIKGLNARGQEGLTLTTLLLIVLGVVVVVVIILGATGAFDFIFGNVDRLPGQSLEVAVQSCKSADSLNLETDYCVNLKKVEIDSVTQHVSCDYLLGKNYFSSDDLVNFGDGCKGAESQPVTFCTSEKLKDSYLVNGVTCKVYADLANAGPPAP